MQIRVWSKVARWSPLVANSLLTKRFRARPPSPPPPPHPRSPARRLCYAYGLVVNNTNVIVARIFPKPLKLVRTNSPHVLRTESVRVFITYFFFSIFNRVKNYVRVRFVTAVTVTRHVICTAHASRWTVRQSERIGHRNKCVKKKYHFYFGRSRPRTLSFVYARYVRHLYRVIRVRIIIWRVIEGRKKHVTSYGTTGHTARAKPDSSISFVPATVFRATARASGRQKGTPPPPPSPPRRDRPVHCVG